MSFVKVVAAVFLTGLVASAAGLAAESLRIPNPWKPAIGPKCRIASKNGCNGSQDCCKGQFCFRCPFCDNVFTRPGTCVSFGGQSCPAPPSCEIRCPEKSCTSQGDCCPFQTCIKCPKCVSNKSVKVEGKCVDLKNVAFKTSLCPKPPLPRCPSGKCEGQKDCYSDEFCFRCPRCEGRRGTEFSGPGTCLSVNGPIPGCAAPPPCDGILLQPALVQNNP